jgi:hypothetical protein
MQLRGGSLAEMEEKAITEALCAASKETNNRLGRDLKEREPKMAKTRGKDRKGRPTKKSGRKKGGGQRVLRDA